MYLSRVDDVVCRGDLSFERFLEIASGILRRGGVDRTVAVGDNGLAVDNVELCAVLKRLGVQHIPVSRGVSEEIYIPLEVLGFFDDINPSRFRVFRDSEELLYRNWPTPLVRLVRASIGGRIIWAKLEGFNPWSMSIKDRIGWYMYRRAVEVFGKSQPSLLVESTSTNTGLAIASMANIHGSRLRAYIPSTVSQTGEALLKIFGVDVVRSSKQLTVELIEDVETVARSEGALHLNQFYNDANFEVHLRYTAKELELQIREAGIVPKAIMGGLGTSGHVSALAFYFKNRFRGVRVYGVVPTQGSTIQGIRRVESGMKWVHHVELDGVIEVTSSEAVEGIIDIVRGDGILVGLSSGAVYAAYKKLVDEDRIDEGNYVLIFPDHGFKYIEQISKYLQMDSR
ncbi:MAG: pyridoxal-phosphate dependent enzyme [Ignisphaera sp.]|nr:pyridoxal-phosphate dependent enzyme [Ignisphaera sp.]MDW8085626.1 pyridoxal-phosphate dependent enzyme [Ignisphaera sp.]